MSSFVVFEPGSELEEIAQNIRTILATPLGSVPLDRGFGVLGLGLDDPIPRVQANMTRDIIDAVAKSETRAEVVSVSFESDNLAGKLSPTVVFRIKTSGVTSSV